MEKVATVILECVSCQTEPQTKFKDKLYCSARFRDFNGYTFTKCFEKPIETGFHKFALTSYKGKINLKYLEHLKA